MSVGRDGGFTLGQMLPSRPDRPWAGAAFGPAAGQQSTPCRTMVSQQLRHGLHARRLEQFPGL